MERAGGLEYVRNDKDAALSTTPDLQFWPDVVQEAQRLDAMYITDADVVKQFGALVAVQSIRSSVSNLPLIALL